jgi:ketosteroid isomerase-like protein
VRELVERYLDAIVRRDWDALRECLADGVERIGPYGDTHRGRDAYVAFLRATFDQLDGYEMQVARIVATATTAVAELTETVDDGDARLRTAEAIVFDAVAAAGGLHLARIAVYLRSSVREPGA